MSVLLLEAGQDLASFKHTAPALAAQPATAHTADWRFEAHVGPAAGRVLFHQVDSE